MAHTQGTQSWFMLTFGMMAEVDARGRKVRGRTIRSLAEHKASRVAGGPICDAGCLGEAVCVREREREKCWY